MPPCIRRWPKERTEPVMQTATFGPGPALLQSRWLEADGMSAKLRRPAHTHAYTCLDDAFLTLS